MRKAMRCDEKLLIIILIKAKTLLTFAVHAVSFISGKTSALITAQGIRTMGKYVTGSRFTLVDVRYFTSFATESVIAVTL